MRYKFTIFLFLLSSVSWAQADSTWSLFQMENGEDIRPLAFQPKAENNEISKETTAAYIPQYSNESVLSEGNWYKLGIVRSGVYKLGYDDLVEMGIDPAAVNPKMIQLYGQYQGMLPEANSVFRPDDLLEDAIEVVGEDDGSFDQGDYILFAGQGPVIWRYNPFTGKYIHTNNVYSDTTFYFLTIGSSSGKRVLKDSVPNGSPTQSISTFLDYAVVDNDLENVAKTGRLWLGEQFEGDLNSRHFEFSFPNRILSKPVYFKMHVAARGIEPTYFSALVNNKLVVDSLFINYVGSNSHYFAKDETRTTSFMIDGEDLDIELLRENSDVSALGWLDYIVINAECALKWRNEPMIFGSPATMDKEKISRFVLSDAPQDIRVWDITSVTSPSEIEITRENDDVTFKVQGNDNQRFIAFSNTGILKPVTWRKIANQNLHGIGSVDMVIVAPEIFFDKANDLAQLHKTNDNLTTVVVTTEQIYNEFSSGMQDISAIRDFMRMLYLKGSFEGKPGYLLLFGDASFDYKNRVEGNTNMVPTFESMESLKETTSFVTDDFYGLLDEYEGAAATGDLDIGIGRLPVSTLEEAGTALHKIEVYTERSAEAMQDWRNTICFVADDQDMNMHLHQAKTLVSIVDTANPELNINKIFSDAYYREKISGGYRYPDAHQAIKDQVEEGALIVNYTGHGGLTGWSEEMILDMPTIRSFSNTDRMPLFITATCEFSRFDDPLFLSAGEQLFLNPNGGGIALMTTTRLAYAHANIALNSRFYFNLNNREGNELPRLGDLIRMSKVPSNINFLNFILLGDPALRLAFPKYNIVTTSIKTTNGKSSDTVRALSTVVVSGEIRNGDAVMNDFNGYLYPKVFGKESIYSTRANGRKSFKEEFTLLDKMFYKGKITVSHGRFEFSFMVPREIALHYGYGKLSYYALDTLNFVDATGYYKKIVVGGVDPDVIPDDEGPAIVMYLNDNSFENNDVVNKNSTLYANLSDQGGINFTGINIGRDILLILDDDDATAQVVNNLFEPDVDSYTAGHIKVPLKGLKDGHHSAAIRVWDLQGNSSEQRIEFMVKSDAAIGLNNVMVYPNPFYDNTTLRFHSKNGGGDLHIEISVFDIAGRRMGSMQTDYSGVGKEIEIPLNWKSVVNGDSNPGYGMFICEMVVTDKNGNKETVRQKIIKLSE